jgi:molybdate transport system substrate-binding protein
MTRTLAVGILVGIALFAAGCAGSTVSTPPAPTGASEPVGPAASEPGNEGVDLTIFAASSLSGVLDKAKAAYDAAHPGTTLTISTDSSSALETQIEQGAPADVFLAADTTNPKKLVDGGFAAGDAVPFAGNKLTIVVPTDNPADIATPADLAKAGVKIVAAGDEVPITRYAKRLVENLARQSGYPADFEADYTSNVVSKEDNVKAIIGKLDLGEGDAAIVYATDALASTLVRTIDVPDSANVPAQYAGVVVKTSAHQEPARTFLGWLRSPDGQSVLASFGFLPPSQ